MNSPSPVMFDNALSTAVDHVLDFRTLFKEGILLVRDLRGRIRVLLPGTAESMAKKQENALAHFSREMSRALGAYGFPPDKLILYTEDLVQGDAVFSSEDRRCLRREQGIIIWLLDRQLMGQDWVRAPIQRNTTNPRITFFGIKGGVGRSTALSILAWQLARAGKHILILDLDLESPGISSTLLPLAHLPEYGIVDWFMEEGIGQPETVEAHMVATSPIARDLPGQIRILPAFGQATGDYLAKLSRCYAEFSGKTNMPWAERLHRMIQQAETKEKPDLVILDSRAGLHDIAAATVTRMDADTLLFAVDSMQTWRAYAFLFRHWQQHVQVSEFRQRLQIVASMIPETGRDAHLTKFREHSWDLFREYLYDETDAQNADPFSFDLDSMEAPHYPLPIYWNRALQEFNPLDETGGMDEQILTAAMGTFVSEVERLIFAREEII